MNNIVQKRNVHPTSKWRWFALFLFLFSFCVIIGMAIIIIYYEVFQLNGNKNMHNSRNLQFVHSGGSSLYQDLTADEINAIEEYVKNKPIFGLNQNSDNQIEKSYIFLIELYLPNKSDILDFLALKLKPPPRNVKMVLIRGDLQPPCVEEYIIGHLNNISFHRLLISKSYQKSVPFLFRPFSQLDHSSIKKILTEVENIIGHILRRSYEASFLNCGNHCLKLGYFSPLAPSVSGSDSRLVWYWTHHDVSNYLLYPVDLVLLVNMTGSDYSLHKLQKIWYGSKLFSSLRQLDEEYRSNKIQKSFIPYTNKIANTQNYITERPPTLYPGGNRLIVQSNHVTYKGWSFDIRMATTTGPSIMNIKFNDVVYVHEISLQEISVFHSGYKRWIRYSDINYSSFLLGTKTRQLVPGVDCPEASTFLHNSHIFDGQLKSKIFLNSFCVFEQPTDMPVRRHFLSEISGIDETTLIVRTILSLDNYDNVIDFVFYHNGVMDVKWSLSGFPLPTVYSPEESHHGFRISDNLVANVHHYACHFKVDLDIFGEMNRFETLDVEPKMHTNDWSINSNSKYEQLKLTRSLRITENLATFKHGNKPNGKFIFYNRDHLTKFKDPRAITLEIFNDKNPDMTENVGNEASVSWKRYLLAVSKRHEDESSSSSIYSMWDAKESIVNFQSYIDDNESIVDQDLVAWVTLSSTRIPHSEDFTTMSATENQQYISLRPFNLFLEDPSSYSPDSIQRNNR